MAELLVQVVDLAGSRSWALDYESWTRNISSDQRDGLKWTLTSWAGSEAIETEFPVKPTSADGWARKSLSWRIPDDARFFRLAFKVRRLLGHVRIEGEIRLRSLRLSPLPSGG